MFPIYIYMHHLFHATRLSKVNCCFFLRILDYYGRKATISDNLKNLQPAFTVHHYSFTNHPSKTLPRTQITIMLIEKGHVLEGSTPRYIQATCHSFLKKHPQTKVFSSPTDPEYSGSRKSGYISLKLANIFVFFRVKISPQCIIYLTESSVFKLQVITPRKLI